MADRYPRTIGCTYVDGTGDFWHALDNQASGDGGGFTEATDAAILSSSVVGAFGISGDMVCQGFDASAYTATISTGSGAGLDVNAGTLAIGQSQVGPAVVGSADISLVGSISIGEGTDFSGFTGTLIQDGTSGTPTITTHGCTLPDLTINNAGVTSFTLTDDMACGSLTLTAGNLTYGANNIDIGGNIAVEGASTNSGTGRWRQTASGTVSIPYTDRVAELHLATTAGVTSTLSTPACKRLNVGPGTIAMGSNTLYVVPTADDPVVIDPDFTLQVTTGTLYLYNIPNGGSVAGFEWPGLVQVSTVAGNAATLTGAWNMGSGEVRFHATDTGVSTLTCACERIACGDFTLGHTGYDDRCAVVNLGAGFLDADNIARAKVGQADNELHFDTSTIALGTLLDGAGITCTNTNAVVVGGTVNNCDLTGETALLHIYPVAGAGNTNVTKISGLHLGAPYAGVAA